MTGIQPIILASASPRRKAMFESLHIPFEVLPADIDEAMTDDEDPVAATRRVAREKGEAVVERLAAQGRDNWVVAADTVVVLGDDVLQKPTGKADARRMLTRLSGQTHRVVTGFAVGRSGEPWRVEHEGTLVTFHELGDQEIDRYAATGEGLDKAGAYAVQGIGTFLVRGIEGDYFNVVGLPVSRVVRVLVQVGALPAFPLP